MKSQITDQRYQFLVLERHLAEHRIEFVKRCRCKWQGIYVTYVMQHAGLPWPILFTAFCFSLVSCPFSSTASSSKKYRLEKKAHHIINQHRPSNQVESKSERWKEPLHLVSRAEEILIPYVILVTRREFNLGSGLGALIDR
jgi:hypothetical protein